MAQKQVYFAFLLVFLRLLVQCLSPLVVLAPQKRPRKTGYSVPLVKRKQDLEGGPESGSGVTPIPGIEKTCWTGLFSDHDRHQAGHHNRPLPILPSARYAGGRFKSSMSTSSNRPISFGWATGLRANTSSRLPPKCPPRSKRMSIRSSRICSASASSESFPTSRQQSEEAMNRAVIASGRGVSE